jgi:hypothetical protein
MKVGIETEGKEIRRVLIDGKEVPNVQNILIRTNSESNLMTLELYFTPDEGIEFLPPSPANDADIETARELRRYADDLEKGKIHIISFDAEKRAEFPGIDLSLMYWGGGGI